MTEDALTRALALINQPRDTDGLARSNNPIGMMVSADELVLRRKIEGGNSPVICAGCGYGRVPDDETCPKCGSVATEQATGLVPREHLLDLLAGHKEAEPKQKVQRAGQKSRFAIAEKRCEKRTESAQAVPDQKRKKKSSVTDDPLAAAQATGKPSGSVEWKRAYMKVWNRNAWAETSAGLKRNKPIQRKETIMKTKTFTMYLPQYSDEDKEIAQICQHAKNLGFRTKSHARACGYKSDLNPVRVTITIKEVKEPR